MNGTTLLADFKASRSESAFGELVRRYTDLVYSVAKRRTSDSSLAQEVAQLVFIRLARSTPALADDHELVAWLHRTTVNASIDLWRSETRRRAREQHAVAMHIETPNDEAWHALAPALDEALNELSDGDRQTLLLRYFRQQSMREVGSAFGVSEDAAKMRVSRALDRLRAQLVRHGVTCGTAGLSTLLAERAVEAAPTALAETLATARYRAATGAAGWLATVLTASKAKLATGIAAALVIGGGLIVSWHAARHPDDPRSSVEAQAASTAATQAAGTTTQSIAEIPTDGAKVEATDPDPLMLLLRVAQGRQRLVSGTMEFTMLSERLDRPVRETNYVRFKTVFDGSKRWFETVRRDYSYAQVGSDASKAADPIITAQGLDREGAVRAGLLKSFESHVVTASDGSNYMKYTESDGRPDGIIIDDPVKGPGRSADYFFDFRCLGLSSFLHNGSTIDACLGYIQAKSIQLVGREPINGVEAWHVRVLKNTYTFDYWIDVARPERLLKVAHGLETVVSQFDPASNDPIPFRVDTTEYRGSTPSGRQHFTRISASFNEPVDPARWSLAGLNPPIGTTVSDLRVRQIIGYWNGVGLSSSPPPARPSKDGKRAAPLVPPVPPLQVDRRELLATLESTPASEEGFDAAEWIMLNTPDGPDVQQAAEVVQAHHLASPRLVRLATDLERFRHRCARPLLEGMLAQNPQIEVRAAACFSLGALLMVACEHGKDAKLAAEAEQFLARAIREFASVRPAGPANVNQARRALGELRQASIGKPAPNFTTVSLNGQPIRLSQLRGQVVVLTFWGCDSEKDNHRALEETAAGKAVVFLGILRCDDNDEKIRAMLEKENITGPTVWARDDRYGPISTAWHVNSSPAIMLIDSAGKIRYRGHYSIELHAMLKELSAH